jgi:hypothetical protein
MHQTWIWYGGMLCCRGGCSWGTVSRSAHTCMHAAVSLRCCRGLWLITGRSACVHAGNAGTLRASVSCAWARRLPSSGAGGGVVVPILCCGVFTP